MLIDPTITQIYCSKACLIYSEVWGWHQLRWRRYSWPNSAIELPKSSTWRQTDKARHQKFLPQAYIVTYRFDAIDTHLPLLTFLNSLMNTNNTTKYYGKVLFSWEFVGVVVSK